jgi:hypothetical protein
MSAESVASAPLKVLRFGAEVVFQGVMAQFSLAGLAAGRASSS